MCGIAGYICFDKYDQFVEKVFPKMWQDSISRGEDACGWAFEKNNKIFYNKRPGLVTNQTTAFLKKQMAKHQPKCVLAHVRNGSHGAPEENINNHPFVNGTMALVHNGVISNYDDLMKKQYVKKRVKSECDSEVILKMIEEKLERSPRKAMIKTNKLISGSATYCLLTTKKKLYIAVHENPMHLVYLPSREILFFNSELRFIKNALKKPETVLSVFNRMPLMYDTRLKEDTIYSFDYVNKKITKMPSKFKDEFADIKIGGGYGDFKIEADEEEEEEDTIGAIPMGGIV